MEVLLEFISVEHLWAILGVVIVSWVIMRPIKYVLVNKLHISNTTLLYFICYAISAGLIFFVWPGGLIESSIAAGVLGSLVPKVHSLVLTAIGKKWPWARTILTNERKKYEEDELTGDDVTVWLNQEQTRKAIEEARKMKVDHDKSKADETPKEK